MIFTLNTLINLCLIAAVYSLSKRKRSVLTRYVTPTIKPTLIAKDLDKYYTASKIAEKMADRAFNMASTANLGVIALQKALAVPRLMTKQQLTRNELAKQSVDKLFDNGGGYDWLRPILSDEELDVLDKAEEHNQKYNVKDETN
jgi:hypothetical protein